MFTTKDPTFKARLPGLRLLYQDNTHDFYDFGDSLLVVFTSRIEAFRVVMSDMIPGKDFVSSQLSLFWFNYLTNIVRNPLVTTDVRQYPDECVLYREELEGRSMLIKKTNPLPVRCVVRGYLYGSDWREYQKNRTVGGVVLPRGLQESSLLPWPLTFFYFGNTKISLKQARDKMGPKDKNKAKMIADVSVRLYKEAIRHAGGHGIIIAGAEFEFGWSDDDLSLVCEILTPDRSDFWLGASYKVGYYQPSFDKQFLIYFLLSLNWSQLPPSPPLPDYIIKNTRDRYKDALEWLANLQLPK